MDIDFNCTQCGKCCRKLWVPLSVAEAIDWLSDGNPVQVFCEAMPWLEDRAASNSIEAFRRERSFPSVSGGLAIRVLVTLAAPQGDACPNLSPENVCRIYERRPAACHIYPAEPNPFLELNPDRQRCPPEAWQAGGTPFMRNKAYLDGELRSFIETKHRRAIEDVPVHQALCGALRLQAAALINEGYVAHKPETTVLLAALRAARERPSLPIKNWEFISNRADTVDTLHSLSARAALVPGHRLNDFAYLSVLTK